jgi:streptogramin lyase
VEEEFTLTSDFDKGNGVNVNYATDQVQLNGAGAPLNFIWVAKSGDGTANLGTVVKIDTKSGAILGEYRTAPEFQGFGNPSRTTVDQDGSVWLSNRNDVYGGQGSVIHIGLFENGQCEDRNGDSIIQTSTGLNDLRPWEVPTANQDDPNLVPFAADECIIHYVKVNSTGTRHISVNDDNDVWVSGSGQQNFDLIKGGGPTKANAGTIIRSETSVSFGGYGGLISGDVIWSAGPLLRWDTKLALSGENGDPSGPDIGPPNPGTNWTGQTTPNSYGLCVDKEGNVWHTEYGGNIHKYAPDGRHLGSFYHGKTTAQGCVIDSRIGGTNDVWVAHSLNTAASVGHLKSNGTLVGVVSLNSAPHNDFGTTGVAVDANGKIWATNYRTHSVTRIDPSANGGVGAADLRVFLGDNAYPYDYSDMTGSTIRAAPTTGSWAVVVNSTESGHAWISTRINWNSILPTDTSLKVKASSSVDGTTYSQVSDVAKSGSLLTLPDGQYLKIIVALARPTSDTASPVLLDLSVREGMTRQTRAPAGKPTCRRVNQPCGEVDQCCSPANKVCEGLVGDRRVCKICLTRGSRCLRTSQCCRGLQCRTGKCSKTRNGMMRCHGMKRRMRSRHQMSSKRSKRSKRTSKGIEGKGIEGKGIEGKGNNRRRSCNRNRGGKGGKGSEPSKTSKRSKGLKGGSV